MPKRILILKASQDVCAAEVVEIAQICEALNLKAVSMDWMNVSDFLMRMSAEKPFDYIYLGAHADAGGFGEAAWPATSWTDFALALCQCDKLNPGCVLFLGCCRGGLRCVADAVFTTCDRVDYVCGPRWTVKAADISVGFHVFLYNLEIRGEQPSCAAQRASQATNYDFFCYDRVELEDANPVLALSRGGFTSPSSESVPASPSVGAEMTVGNT